MGRLSFAILFHSFSKPLIEQGFEYVTENEWSQVVSQTQAKPFYRLNSHSLAQTFSPYVSYRHKNIHAEEEYE